MNNIQRKRKHSHIESDANEIKSNEGEKRTDTTKKTDKERAKIERDIRKEKRKKR